jgi:hypothetical protein
MFDIPRVMVAKAVKATNNEGASEAYGFAYGKKAHCLPMLLLSLDY